jgi:nucleotide-binding universal stress UspA family protein
MSRHILVTLDSSGQSERILVRVLLLARRGRSTLHLLVVYPSRPVVASRHAAGDKADQREVQAIHYLRKVAAQLRKEGLLVSLEVRFGDPVETILAAARDVRADLIAMTVPWLAGDGSRSFRNIPEQVIKKAPLPVLVERLCEPQTV